MLHTDVLGHILTFGDFRMLYTWRLVCKQFERVAYRCANPVLYCNTPTRRPPFANFVLYVKASRTTKDVHIRPFRSELRGLRIGPSQIRQISVYPNLNSLELEGWKFYWGDYQGRITDDDLKPLARLKILKLAQNNRITDVGLHGLNQLAMLHLGRNQHVTDAGLANLANLTWLHLGKNPHITDAGLPTSLEKLKLGRGANITGSTFRLLCNLTHLDLGGCTSASITDARLRELVSLTSLHLSWEPTHTITDAGLSPQLVELSLGGNEHITVDKLAELAQLNLRELHLGTEIEFFDEDLPRFAKLAVLGLGLSGDVTDAGIRRLTSLTTLHLAGDVTDAGIRRLTSLTTLHLAYAPGTDITGDGLNALPNLTELHLSTVPISSVAGAERLNPRIRIFAD